MKTTTRVYASIIALLITAAGVFGQAPSVTPPPTRPTPPAVRPNENASDNARAVHALLDQFKTQRDQFLAARQELINRLKTATGDERKTILDQLRADQQARVDEQRALGKQIRDELKTLNRGKKSGG